MSKYAAAMVLVLAGQFVHAAAIPQIVLKNDSIEYTLSAEGKNLSFLAKGLGKEYLVGPGQQAVVTLKKGGTSYAPMTCRFAAGKVAQLLCQSPSGVCAVVEGHRICSDVSLPRIQRGTVSTLRDGGHDTPHGCATGIEV